MGAHLRPARLSDLPLVAEVLCMAARGHLARGPWDFVFPQSAERERALARIASGGERSFCHLSVFTVAELDGVPSAAMCAFEPSELGPADGLGAALAATFEMVGTDPRHVAEVGPKLAAYTECFPDMPAGTWIVENVATRPEARRRGLVAALLARALDEGRRRGHRTAQISCLIGNDAAQRAYEHAGFRVIETRATPAFEALMGAPGFSRLTLELSSAGRDS